MKTVLQAVLLTLSVVGIASAENAVVPEINAGNTAGALGLIAGVLLVMRSRRKR